jgi:hypothetical protein
MEYVAFNTEPRLVSEPKARAAAGERSPSVVLRRRRGVTCGIVGHPW